MIPQERVLIVDDDVRLVHIVRDYLVDDGFTVSMSHTFESGMTVASEGNIDLAVLDVTLPDGSGLDLFHAIRATSFMPVLLLNNQSDVAERLRGLDDGADDYLSKPCDPHELVARIRAIHRRAHRDTVAADAANWLRAGDLTLSPTLRKATYSGHDLHLTSVEFNLVEYLLHRCEVTISREELSCAVLGRAMGLLDRSIDVHVSRIRRKLEHCGATNECIRSVRGAGYLLIASRTEV
jgi:two-component system response regulator CpxR